jgi:hypothetical protein
MILYEFPAEALSEFEAFVNQGYALLGTEIHTLLTQLGPRPVLLAHAQAQALWEGLPRYHAPPLPDSAARQDVLWVDARLIPGLDPDDGTHVVGSIATVAHALDALPRLRENVQSVREISQGLGIPCVLVRAGEGDHDVEVLCLDTGVTQFRPIYHFCRIVPAGSDRGRYTIIEGQALDPQERVEVRVRLRTARRRQAEQPGIRMLRLHRDSMEEFLYFLNYRHLEELRFFVVRTAGSEVPSLFYVLGSSEQMRQVWFEVGGSQIGTEVMHQYQLDANLTTDPRLDPTERRTSECWTYIRANWTLAPTIRIPKDDPDASTYIRGFLTSFLQGVHPGTDAVNPGEIVVLDPMVDDPSATLGGGAPPYRIARMNVGSLRPLRDAYDFLAEPAHGEIGPYEGAAQTPAARLVLDQVGATFWRPALAAAQSRLLADVALFDAGIQAIRDNVDGCFQMLQAHRALLDAHIRLATMPLDDPGIRNRLETLRAALARIDSQIRTLHWLGFDLRVMSWGNGSGVPTTGRNMVVVGTDHNGLLQIRIFDATGKRITDTDETRLPAQRAAIATLKRQLPGWLPPRVLTEAEKAQVIREVASLVDQTYGRRLHDDGSLAPPGAR